MSQRNLQRLYKDVINGYSKIRFNDQDLYVKHVATMDMGTVEAFEKERFQEAKSKGLFTKEEKIKFLIEDGVWSEDSETRVKELADEVSGLKITIKKLFLASQQKKIRNEIKKRERELNDLETERKDLLGITCESYSDQKANQEFLRISLYEDKELKKLKFDDKGYFDLTNQDLLIITNSYNFTVSDFTSDAMKCIAASPFFLNTVLLCKSNPMIFFGKPVVDLSNYQVDLFTHGLRYKNVLEDGKTPPETSYKDIQQVVDWYEMTLDKTGKTSKTINKDGTKKEADGQTIFGANQEELETYTSTDGDDRKTTSLLAQTKKHGKTEDGKTRIGFKEFLDMHGH